MWDSVPWMVGGGAEHSPETARLVSYAATRSEEGVLEPGDLKVTALTTPDGFVRVSSGAAVVRNRGPVASENQSYIGRNPSQDTITIPATGGTARTDLIVVRVEDPYNAGEPWADPPDAKVGPYIFTRVVSNVSAGATAMPAGQSGIVLARINIPAATSAITQAMITDLRQIALPRRTRLIVPLLPGGIIDAASTSFITWPGSVTVPVPAWASKVHVVGVVYGASLQTASAVGEMRVKVGNAYTQPTTLDENWTGNPTRMTYGAAGTISLDINDPGTTATVAIQARRTSGSGKFRADTATTGTIDLQFEEAAR